MRDILDLKKLFLQPFRPFAASILRKGDADWFEKEDEFFSTMKILQIREEKRGDSSGDSY